MNIGTLGVWMTTEAMSATAAAAFARRVEKWGYGALWLPEAFGRNVLVHAAWLLANTEKLVIATGIANIYARDAMAMRAAQHTLAEQSGGRFLLGIGVSHGPLVEGTRGHRYEKPLETMRRYLEDMAQVRLNCPPPPERPKTLLAALGEKMLALAGEAADGAHPYLVTPEHTARARAILGPGKWLCPEQKVLLETDARMARSMIRTHLAGYLQLPNYVNNLRALGFSDADFAGNGSDHLVDALVAWGDETAVRRRIQEHYEGGADHVCIQTLSAGPYPPQNADERLLTMLAPRG